MRGRLLSCLPALALLLVLAAVPARAESQKMVHFIVVSYQAADGADIDAAITELKAKFLELAGGYTELGITSGGYLPPGGAAVKSDGRSFLVAADTDLSAEIMAWAESKFVGPPFILVWPAKCSF